MMLPNGEHARVSLGRLRDYNLNPDHPTGKHKARVLAAALGFTQTNARQLQTILKRIAHTHPAIEGAQDEHGQRYTIDFELENQQDELVTLRSGWMIDVGETIPRYLTVFVITKSER